MDTVMIHVTIGHSWIFPCYFLCMKQSQASVVTSALTAYSIPCIVIQVGTHAPSVHEVHFQFPSYINYPACIYFSSLWILTRLIPLSPVSLLWTRSLYVPCNGKVTVRWSLGFGDSLQLHPIPVPCVPIPFWLIPLFFFYIHIPNFLYSPYLIPFISFPIHFYSSSDPLYSELTPHSTP